MPACSTCGSARIPCDCEAVIASWIEAVPVPARQETPELACVACGYSGGMTEDDWGTRCPACGVALPPLGPQCRPQVTRLVECPECGREIGITSENEGRTVVCPGCSYFLGTPVAKPGRGR